MTNQFKNFRIAARGLILQDEKLLFVSDDGEYWYLPGGRLEGNETLPTCVAREVYEETGLSIRVGSLLYLAENLDYKEHNHKIDFYFQTELLAGTISDQWQDEGGVVLFRRFFSLDEIIINQKIYPRFLATKNWLHDIKEDIQNMRQDVYQGCTVLCGSDVLETI